MEQYKIIDNTFTKSYIDIYQKAVKNNKERECFIGAEPEYRIRQSYSHLINYTDMDILIEYCLYPSYHLGDTKLPSRICSVLEEMIKLGSLVDLFQVSMFISKQDSLEQEYINLPFKIDSSKLVKLFTERFYSLSDEEKDLQGGELSNVIQSLYEMVQRVMKNSPSFQKYS